MARIPVAPFELTRSRGGRYASCSLRRSGEPSAMVWGHKEGSL